MQPVVLTARLNEMALRTRNPHVPWSPAEIAAAAAACAEAGAAIVHFHGRDVTTGGADPRPEVLAEIVERIDAACDVVTLCNLGAGLGTTREARLASLLDAATKPDLAPIDLGSFNLDPFDPQTREFTIDEGIYVNTVGTVRYLLEGITRAGVAPAAVAWSVGSLRLLGALLEQGLWPRPVYAELVVSDRILSVNPATTAGLDALVPFRPDVPMLWTAMCVSGSVLPLIDDVVARGGGLAFGLGDHPYPELGTPTNADVVAAVAARVRACGSRPATPAEVRAHLAGTLPARRA